jgi:hypothetical protein
MLKRSWFLPGIKRRTVGYRWRLTDGGEIHNSDTISGGPDDGEQYVIFSVFEKGIVVGGQSERESDPIAQDPKSSIVDIDPIRCRLKEQCAIWAAFCAIHVRNS